MMREKQRRNVCVLHTRSTQTAWATAKRPLPTLQSSVMPHSAATTRFFPFVSLRASTGARNFPV
jgi:hypothetical protein